MAGNIVVPDAEVLVAINAYLATSDWASGQVAHLFINNIVPTPADTVGSFTEASYPGYTTQTPTPYSGPTGVLSGQYALTSQVMGFPSPNAGGSVALYGVYVTSTMSGNLLYSWQFSAPITLNVGDPSLTVQVVYDAWAAILI